MWTTSAQSTDPGAPLGLKLDNILLSLVFSMQANVL